MQQIASPQWVSYLVVGLGSAVGGMLRYGCSGLFAGSFAGRLAGTFPWATLFVNVTGSLLIGVLAGLTQVGRLGASSWPRELLMVGLLGGYTTFSAFSLQTLMLMREGRWGLAAANVCFSLALCLFAVWLGFLLATGAQNSSATAIG